MNDYKFKEGRESGGYLDHPIYGWYSHKLTKDECIELSELFRELADETRR